MFYETFSMINPNLVWYLAGLLACSSSGGSMSPSPLLTKASADELISTILCLTSKSESHEISSQSFELTFRGRENKEIWFT